jgi:hypothetical protein
MKARRCPRLALVLVAALATDEDVAALKLPCRLSAAIRSVTKD